jgi:hypothetical protein
MIGSILAWRWSGDVSRYTLYITISETPTDPRRRLCRLSPHGNVIGDSTVAVEGTTKFPGSSVIWTQI